jgi:hypothetical protein
MNCTRCEEQLSDYLEDALGAGERDAMDAHLRTCQSCHELVVSLRDVLMAVQNFPVYDPPLWIPTRILANTPLVARETWRDTLSGMVRWIREPRMAMIVFTATVVLSWMGSLAGVSPAGVARVIQDPAILYYEAETRLNRAYGTAIRTYYSTPIVTQIHSQIERLREIS